MFNTCLYVSLYSCIALVGLIWVIQIVHYPSFHFIDKSQFASFESFHGLRISIVVIPLMLLELGSSVAILFNTASDQFPLMLLAMALLLAIWLITFLVSSPIHGELMLGYNKELIDKLVSTNWWRTGLWTVRSLILIYIVKQV